MNNVTRAVFVLVLVAATPWCLSAQWRVEQVAGKMSAASVGANGNLRVSISCTETAPFVELTLLKKPNLSGGVVGLRWDDGSVDRYEDLAWVANRTPLGTGDNSLVLKLRRRLTVQVEVGSLNEALVTDDIGLSGSSRAIRSLPCLLTDTEIRRILIRQSIASYSGSCPCPYNSDRAGRRCGGRSAYSRRGGASPLCYESDVSNASVEAYRRR